jgi:hypothetical protein
MPNLLPPPKAGDGRRIVSKIITRLLPLAMLAGLLVTGLANMAHAQQSIGAGKQICVGHPTPNACPAVPATGVPIGSSVYYLVTLSPNSTTPSPVTLNETYPAGFTFLDAECYAGGSTSPNFSITNATSNGLSLGPVPVPAATQVVCVINGFFNIPGVSASNSVSIVNAGGTVLNTAQVQATVQQNPVLTGDLSVTKSVTPTSIDVSAGPATLHYTIQITNSLTGVPLYLGSIFELTDQLALIPGSVPLMATYVPGSATCQPVGPNCLTLNPVPINPLNVILPTAPQPWQPFLKWRFPTGSLGILAPGATLTVKYDVEINKLQQYNCIITGDGVRNQAFITFASGTTAIADQNPANNTFPPPANPGLTDVTVYTGATFNDPDCGSAVLAPPPVLKVDKIQKNPLLPTAVLWGGSADYELVVTNTSNSPVTLTTFKDFLEEDPGTPLFKATATPMGCVSPVFQGTGTTQQFQGYYSTLQMWNNPLVVVPANGSITCKIRITFSNQTCDSWDGGLPSLVTNILQVKYKATVPINNVPTQVTYTLYAQVDTPMQQAGICKFEVRKRLLPATQTKVVFGTPVTYQVQFINNEPVTRVVGTLGDFVRIVQPNYATSMPISYGYACFQNGGVTGYIPFFNSSTLSQPPQVVHTAFATQGVQVLLQHNVTFPSGGMLTCNITVTVQRPPVNDPFCLSSEVPQFENIALMDISPSFNPNLNWPPSGTYIGTTPPPLPASQPPQPATGPTNWSTVTLPLPKCFHLQVNKSSNPTTVMTTGGPITYTLTIQNLGDTLDASLPPAFPPNSYPWALQDQFLPNNTLTPTMNPPLTLNGCTGPDCAWLPNGNPYAPQFMLGFNKFPQGSTVTVQFTVPGPYNPNQICNDASAFMVGPTVNQDWYANNYIDPATTPKPPIHYCVPVTVPTSLQVTKKTQYLPGVPIPNPQPGFPLNVSCAPSGPITNPPLILVNGGPPQLVNNIPSGSNCTLTETVAAVPPNYPPYCHWAPTFVVDGVPHTANPFTITNIAATPNPHIVDVLNNLVCTPPASLQVTKNVEDLKNGGIPMPNPPPPFALNVSCTSMPPGPNLIITNGGPPQLVGNIPPGSNCTITETVPPVLPPYAPSCHWAPTLIIDGVAHPNPFTILNIQSQPNPHTIVALNKFDCAKMTSLNVFKTVGSSSGAALPPLPQFPVHVNCSPNGPVNVLLNLAGNGSPQPVNNVTVGGYCTITETVPVVPPNAQNCHWVATLTWNNLSHPNGSQIANIQALIPPQSVEVHNDFVCSGSATNIPITACPPGTIASGKDCVRPIVCRPPLTPNAAGTACACPEGTVQSGRDCVKPPECRPPMVANAAGACACPEGTLQQGRDCVKPPECRPPMVRNAAGACACPQGTMQKGLDCVKPIECRPPMIANPGGTGCACPRGMQQKGEECVVPGRPDKGGPRGDPRGPADSPGRR